MADNTLYIEAHPDLEGEETTLAQKLEVALKLIQKANIARDGVYAASQSGTGAAQDMPEFDRKALNHALTILDGNPVALYERSPQQTLPVALPAGHGSKGGYYHGI